MTEPQKIRQAILAAPFEIDNKGEVPRLGTLYVPPAHRKALHREAVLVVGGRGVGKSFWTAALSDKDLLNKIGESVPELKDAQVWVGFSQRLNTYAYPDKDIFQSLLRLGYEPYVVWRAIVARWLTQHVGENIPVENWETTVRWVNENPEPFSRIAEAVNEQFRSAGRFGLIIFDALDRVSDDWDSLTSIVRDLLRVALWLRDFSHISAKVFLRPDQLDRSVIHFVDASKLMATRADLVWERHDLHAMMWQRLINAPGEYGKWIREIVSSILPKDVTVLNASIQTATQILSLYQDDKVWYLPEILKSEVPPYQRQLFSIVAGDKMGNDVRRGVPYVWSVNHLADGHGRTSPRSFLTAIRAAAEDSQQRYSNHPFPLHYESIKRGILKASLIRISEIAEDDPWVPEVMKPLEGMSVPADYETFLSKWQAFYPDGPGSVSSYHLRPPAIEGWAGVRNALERLGILITRRDGRIDVPDLYRVGFRLGRKGGVRPRT